ncbi:MAG: hypothetical protein PWR12_1794 [Eubacteriaceae bacterium]|nr:hypothetical protein [Eubacteriaceae bacterium]
MYICTLKGDRCDDMQDKTDYTMLYRVAKYYYEDNLSQNEIAQKEHVSRPHISRLLDKARECGIVQIKVVLPNELQISKIKNMLQKELRLNDVIVVPVPTGISQNSKKLSISISTVAARRLPELIRDCSKVGIGWGFTMYQTSLQLTYCDSCKDVTFIPLIGISGVDNPYFQINTILDRFAEKFGADSFYTNIPAVREKDCELPQIEKKRYAKLQQYWNKLDAAIIGLGAPPNVGKFPISEVSHEYKEMIINSNAIGDILCQFFCLDGSVIDCKSHYEQFSFPIHKLRDIKKVICLAGGPAKVNGIITAARNNFYNILVTDSVTASLILDRL